MMIRPDDLDRWHRFLEADRAGVEAEADLALRALFAALPARAPRPGFADRVVARISRRPLFAGVGARLALAASLAIAALGGALFAPAIVPLARWIGPARLLGGGVALIAELSVRFADGVAFWHRLGEIGGTIAYALTRPQLLIWLTIPFALALVALRALAGLSQPRRSTSHAAV
jgi:hypothetical protein